MFFPRNFLKHLLHILCAGSMELVEKPVEKTDKGKNPMKTPRGKEEKA